MHHFNIKTSKIFLGRGTALSPDPTSTGEADSGHPLPIPHSLVAFGVSAPPPSPKF